MSWSRACGVAMISAFLVFGAPAQKGPVEETREQRMETVNRCIRDLKSTDVHLRRRAALLLGKYATPVADRALIGCLKDPDAQIRLGALVSLTEGRILPGEARMPVLQLMADENVFIRRQATALLGDVFGFPVQGNLRVQGSMRMRPRGIRPGSDDWKIIHRWLLQALDDPDEIVRRNVLMTCRLFDFPVPRHKVLGYLKDSKPEIRSHGFWLLTRQIGDIKTFLADIQPLLKDEVDSIRLEVCLYLPTLGKEMEPALRDLSQDANGEVRAFAVEGLCRLGVADKGSLLESILLDESLPASARGNLVWRVIGLPRQQATAIYARLLKSSSSELAERAMDMLSRPNSGWSAATHFIPYLDSPNQRIADLALRGIRLRNSTLKAQDCLAIMGTKGRRGKEQVLAYGLQRMTPQERMGILTEACMDEDISVRINALKRLASLTPPGWEEIVIASLDDEDAAIASCAAELLVKKPSEEGRQALRNYLPRCKSHRLKWLINRALK